MEEHIRNDILDVLRHAVRAIHREDIKGLKELSNMTIHNASIHQDHYSISVSVLIYTLAKLYERERYNQYKSWGLFCIDCVDKLQSAIRFLELKDYPHFDTILKEFLNDLKKTEKGLRKYVKDVLEKARISKASRLHEHGISIGRTAELLGISPYELMEYVGRTYIADVKENITIPEKDRITFARKLFS